MAYITNSGLGMSGVDIEFRGGNCKTISGVQPLSERHNYFLGSNFQPRALTYIATYRRVRCEQLYSGIDAEFYGDGGRVEYDLIVAPGADSSVVKLAWKHAKGMRIDGKGDLIVEAPGGVLRHKKPVVYQLPGGKRRMVEAGYVLTGQNEARLSLGPYNRGATLIIDPVLLAVDANAAPAGPMAVDSAGNVYLAGSTASSSFESTAGSLQPTFGGGTCDYEAGTLPPVPYPCPDAYVIKIAPSGGVVYATYLGGNGADLATSIAVDSSGNAYVAGSTNPNPSSPNNFPITPGAAFTKPSADGADAFVAKLNAAGSALIYSTFIPEIYQVSLAIDAQGAAYIAGWALPPGSGSSGFPTTPGAFQTTSTVQGITGGVAKLNPNGSALEYATYLGGTNPNNYADPAGATGIAVDAAGAAYLTGWTVSTDFPTTPGAYNRTPANGGLAMAYVTKLNAAGSRLIYSTFLGETAGSTMSTIKLDVEGNAYILGPTNSSSFPVTGGAFQPNGPGAAWALPNSAPLGQFLSVLNPDGTALKYSTYLLGAGALDVDSAGDAFAVGVASYNFPVTRGAFQRCVSNGAGDLFVIELDHAGAVIGATYLGGTGTETPSAIVAGVNGSAYVAGTTSSIEFPGITGAASGVPLTFVTQIQVNDPKTVDGPCISQTLQNAASFQEGGAVPGELVTIRGAGIGPVQGVSGQPGPDGKYPTELAGVQVFFDGFPAPLLYVQAEQINTVVPWGAVFDYQSMYQGGPEVSVKIGGVSTNKFTIPTAEAQPGIFVTNAANQAAVLNQDGTVNSPENPAAPGTVVAIFGTGGGMMNSFPQTGEISPSTPNLLSLPVTVQIEEENADILYAGSAPGLISGVFQINARLPKGLGPASTADLTVTIGSIASPLGPTRVAIQ